MPGTWWDETGPDGHPSRRIDPHAWTPLPDTAARPPAHRGRRRRRRDPDSLRARLAYALLLAALAVPPAALAVWSLGRLAP